MESHALIDIAIPASESPWTVWPEILSRFPDALRQAFLKILREHAPEIFSGKPGLTLGIEQSEAVLEKLLEGTLSRERRAIQYVFRTGLSRGNDVDLWAAALPSYRFGLQHYKTTLDPKLFALRDTAKTIEDKLFNQIEEILEGKPSIMAGLVLASATLHGPLISSKSLEALFACRDFWFEGGQLRYEQVDVNDQDIIGFVPLLTQCFLHAFQHRHGLSMATAVENELGRPALYSDCLTFLAQQLALDKDEARVLCSAPHRLSHARSMTVLHPYLHAYLRQRNQATALSSAGWTALFTGIRPLCADPAEDTKKPNHADQNEPDDTNTDEILENDQSGRGSEVLHVLAQLAKTGATITIKDAKIVLENLDTASYWPIEIMLRDWAVDQMARAIKRKQGAPSSVLRYYSALRLPLCAAAETFDLREADTQSLNELFDDALDWPESDQARAFLTQRLQQLYSFCVDRYPEMSKEMDFKALDNAHFGGKIRVRNLYPTEVEYQATVRMMLDGEPFEALPQNRQASLLAGIIAYRGNLRLSETTRLLFMDFQDGIFPEIIIRPSAWGKLKSHQAERRIPVLAFFDDSELAMIRVYVEGRSKTCISSDVLLTNDESGRPMPGAKLFQAFIKALRAVTRNDHFSAHALRHGSVNSTLIRLHVADGMEIPESIVGLNFPRFKKPSCDKLVEILMGRKPDGFLDFQGLFALAVLMGHLSPATTLKSYIHVQDLITHLIWTSANSPTLGSKQVAALIGVSNQRVHQLLTERGLATRDAGNGDYLEITRKQLGAFQSRTQSLMDIPKSIAATLDENELAENIAHRARLLKHLNQPNFDN